MGTCYYYIKAQFETEAAAETARQRFADLIAENAGDWWQSHRGEDASTFWPEFRARFPITCEVLEGQTHDAVNGQEPLPVLGGNPDGLSGWLDFGSNGDTEPWTGADGLLAYHAEIWHFTTWNQLDAWLRRIGAKAVGWISEEDASLYDCVVMD